MRTAAALEEKRDTVIPALLAALYRREVLLTVYSERSIEDAGRAREDLLYVQNSRTVYGGELAGLLDPDTIQQIAAMENSLKSATANQSALDPRAPFNFVTTTDCVGGSSGSPVFDRNGEFVGIFFDENIQSLSWDDLYANKQARAVAVDSRAILEALQRVYQLPTLVSELTGKTIK